MIELTCKICNNAKYKRKCEACGMKYFTINMNYEEEMGEIYRFIEKVLESESESRD